MAEVNIEINGRKYRMACEDGQESQLVQLGERFNKFVDNFKEEFGEIGDNRLIIMAGIAVVDALVEAEEKMEKLQAELDFLSSQNEKLNISCLELEKKFTDNMTEIAQKIEIAASKIETINNK